MPVISRSLALSLGTTSVVSVLLFLYFRNKISSVEHKVSMLFKLIEEHHQQQQVQCKERIPSPPQFQTPERINVSDDDASEDEDSDDEYSDEEESLPEGRLSIEEQGGAVKTIEIEPLGQQDTNNLDDIPSLGENDGISVNKAGTEHAVQDTNNDMVYNNLMQGISKKTETQDLKSLKIKELKAICAERGLNKYSSLNKAKLVELLER
jgi:hypothetical protein